MDLFENGGPGGNAPEFSVSEISGAVKRVIEGEFGRVRVRGEIGRISRPASGHLYLDLKDDRSVLAAVVWKGSVRGLSARPEEGMEVVATGRLTTFGNASKYQMVIEEMAPAGVGALMAMLEKRRTALAAEGLFDEGRKRPLPFLPEVIGVVTSPSGAVIRDILHRLRERFPRRVLVWPVTVQGPNCAAEVAAAIRGFNALAPGGRVPRPDLLIVARGGGSLEDLWGFNEEIVVRAAAASAIPLISAVGHETDTTLIDFAADRRAPTPTAAAEMAVPVRLDLLAALGGLEERRRGALARDLERRRQRLRDLARGLPRAEALLADRAQRLDGLALRLPFALTALTRHRRLDLAGGASGRFGEALFARGVERRRDRLQRAALGLARPEALLAERARRLEGLASRLPRALAALTRARRLDLAGGAAGRFGEALFARGVERRRERALRAGLGLRAEAMSRALGGLAARLGLVAARLGPEGPERIAHRLRERLEARAARLGRIGPAATRERRAALEGAARVLASLGPERVLARGFAIVRDEAGRVLPRAEAARGASGYEIEFADGRVRAKPAKAAKKGKAPEQGTLF